MSATQTAAALSEARNWFFGGFLAIATGATWIVGGWFANGCPDFFSFLIALGGAICLGVGGMKALKLAARAHG